MNNRLAIACVAVFFCVSCDYRIPPLNLEAPDWVTRPAPDEPPGSWITGQTYLPVYSHVYHADDNRPFYLTATVSIRNVSDEIVHLTSADYYDTEGRLVQEYLEAPVPLGALETLQIVILESDVRGGSGAKLVFGWAVPDELSAPIFDAVMVSTRGQQGLSFSTSGVRIF